MQPEAAERFVALAFGEVDEGADTSVSDEEDVAAGVEEDDQGEDSL